LEFAQKIGPARVAAMGGVVLALVAFFAFVIMRVSQPAMGILYSELSLQDAGVITRDLDARGVRYETRADGQTILAPKNDLARLRMEFAAKGVPAGGGVGYEIFDKGDAFSSTSFVQNINHLRALEGELARTIRSIGRVQNARVHLAIPERRLFERDREPPRASIVLRLRGELENTQIRAIRHLVASAVEGLRPDRISIVDEQGRLLADGAQGDVTQAAMVVDEKQAGLERRLKRQIEEIVAGVVGSGRARVQVAAEFDLNRVESRSETYDPESRVVRSTQTREENQTSAANDGAVSVGNELPGATPQGGAGTARDTSAKTEETVNYEISRTMRTEVLEGGRLKRLSVAVLVDGAYSRGANGELSYQPRSQEDLERISTLVRTAIGYDQNRGDQVEVVNLRFADAPQEIELAEESLLTSLLNPTKEDIFAYLEIAVIVLLTLMVLLMVVRPLVKQVIGPGVARTLLPAAAPAIAAAGEVPVDSPGRDSPTMKMLELARVNGEVQQKSIEKIGELVKTNPAESVAVLRQWINDRN
jgi:flagellar M-ring protein FliF